MGDNMNLSQPNRTPSPLPHSGIISMTITFPPGAVGDYDILPGDHSDEPEVWFWRKPKKQR